MLYNYEMIRTETVNFKRELIMKYSLMLKRVINLSLHYLVESSKCRCEQINAAVYSLSKNLPLIIETVLN